MATKKFLDYDGLDHYDSKLKDYIDGIYAKKEEITGLFHYKGGSPTIPSPTKVGEVWNISAEFITTQNFVEGQGKTYPAGTNIVCIALQVDETTIVWDVLPGFVDLTGVEPQSITDNEINSLF